MKYGVNSGWFCIPIFTDNSTFGGHLGVIFFFFLFPPNLLLKDRLKKPHLPINIWKV